ncbi:Fanconi anemia group E protein isoform X2 [Anguilla anguilla]|uniref:Fanconi anemia group E protein isoform X1 n=1 Tax=Anguilla anguilla TaxID=7936 RepID=UPI0015A7AD8B|nr:Fanconi anemia group E protein isoform X1 [Anguilla anguilla]XP_035238752.1 Fanconi anemia group E protein isoform X2 [Anguilla anguilla]
MDADDLLQRFDGRSRLLLRSLLSGVKAARRALWVFRRQRRCEPDLFIHACMDTLCQDEPCLDGEALTLRPLVCLFPVAFKRNLLSFLHLVHLMLPRPSLVRLLDCLSQDPSRDPWIRALLGQLRRDLQPQTCNKDPLLTPQGRERLGELCGRLASCGGLGARERFSWFSGLVPVDLPDPESQRKRTSESAGFDVDGVAIRSKRRRTDGAGGGKAPSETDQLQLGWSQLTGDIETVPMETVPTETVPVETVPVGGAVEPQQLSAVGPSSVLPEHIKASVPRIKELLETEWDQGSSSVLQVLNECDPSQVELLCEALCLSEVPEQTLPQFITSLLGLSPDLSFSTAATLIRSLFLGKVHSLSEPASRCLVTAMTSLCSRYPRSTCFTLIGPVLEAGQSGSAQAELLCRLIEDCLEPHYQILVFERALAVAWSEGVLSVIHTLLDSQLELSADTFSLFTTRLSQQAPQFTTSMKFAKMVLTVLTKYQSHVNATHKHSLACSLDLNQTFLKKSLQAALKRISPA